MKSISEIIENLPTDENVIGKQLQQIAETLPADVYIQLSKNRNLWEQVMLEDKTDTSILYLMVPKQPESLNMTNLIKMASGSFRMTSVQQFQGKVLFSFYFDKKSPA